MSEGNPAPEPAWYVLNRWVVRVFAVLMGAAALSPPWPSRAQVEADPLFGVFAACRILFFAWFVWLFWTTARDNHNQMGRIERVVVWAAMSAFAACVVARWFGVGPLAYGWFGAGPPASN